MTSGPRTLKGFRILSGLRDLIAKQNSHTQRYHKQKTQKETTDSLSRDRPKRNSEVDYSIPLLVSKLSYR